MITEEEDQKLNFVIQSTKKSKSKIFDILRGGHFSARKNKQTAYGPSTEERRKVQWAWGRIAKQKREEYQVLSKDAI